MEELVAERVAEEMEKRKDEIEAEVLRRVEEAKTLMEQQVKMSLLGRQSLRSFVNSGVVALKAPVFKLSCINYITYHFQVEI